MSLTSAMECSSSPLRPLAVDIVGLEWAFSNSYPGYRAFLDTTTGAVVESQGAAGDDPAQTFTGEPGRFLLIEPMCSRIQHAWMQRFIVSVAEPALRAALTAAVGGLGAFREFKRTLRRDARERERWYRFRSTLLRIHIHAWLRLYGISPVAPSRSPTPDAGDGPGEEALRRLAEQYLERLPESSLGPAIVYLRFLQATC